MNFKTTFMALALIAGFGLALGGCSSSSDDPPMEPDITLDQATMGATVEEGTHVISEGLAAAFDDVSEEDAAGLLGVDHPEDTIISIAGLDIACTAGPCSVALNDDGTITTTGTIEVVMAGGEFPTAMRPDEEPTDPEPTEEEKAAAQIAELQNQINALRATLGLDPIDIDDLTGSVADLTTQLETLQTRFENMQTADRVEKYEGLFAAAKQEVTGEPEYPAGEAVIDVSVVKGVVTVKFEETGNAITDTTKAVTLADYQPYSNQGDPIRRLFTKQYEGRLTEPSDVLSLVDANMDGKHAEADGFPLNGGTATYTDADTADDDLPDSIALRGSLMGATGTFMCGTEGTGGNCTISEDKGDYTFGTGWSFDPDDGQMVTVADSDYTRYGWWAYKRKDETFRVGTFYAHVGPTASDVAAIPGTGLGTATYNGSAAGKYAIDNRPTGTVLDAGHFEAAATISANLGATPTVSGTINGFTVFNDDAPDGEARDGWSVALGMTGISWAAGDDFSTVGDTGGTGGIVDGGVANVWSINGVKGAADGDWQGGFYHDGTPRLDDTPANVVGSFSASHGTNAYMVGAFGASNLAADRPKE